MFGDVSLALDDPFDVGDDGVEALPDPSSVLALIVTVGLLPRRARRLSTTGR